ncbi:MAG: energy transducer TonB [Bacteroidales bacterium]
MKFETRSSKIDNPSFDEIIFENRNQAYGAFELRKKYPRRLSISVIFSLIILGVTVGIPLIINIINQKDNKVYLEKTATLEMSTIKERKDEILPPPPPSSHIAPVMKEIKFIAPKIVDTLSSQEQELSTTSEIGEVSKPLPSTDTIKHEVTVIVEEKQPIEEKIYEIYGIEEKPIFPGGDAGLKKYVYEHIKYPVIAIQNGIEGTVYIRFVVTKNGDIGETIVARSVDPLLDKEALRVIKALPKWIPAKNNGVPVSVWCIFPIKYAFK